MVNILLVRRKQFPIFPYPHQQLLWPVFLFIAILMDMTGIHTMNYMASHIRSLVMMLTIVHVFIGYLYVSWRNVYLNLLPMFNCVIYLFIVGWQRVLYVMCIQDLYQVYYLQTFYSAKHPCLAFYVSYRAFKNLMKPWTLSQQSAHSHQVLYTFSEISQGLLRPFHNLRAPKASMSPATSQSFALP